MSNWSAALFEQSPLPMAVHRLLKNEHEVLGFAFVSTNKAFERLWANLEINWHKDGGTKCHPYPGDFFEKFQITALANPMGNRPLEIPVWSASEEIWYTGTFYSINENEFACTLQVPSVKDSFEAASERLRHFVNGSPDSIQVSDLKGQMVFINQEGANRLGISPEQISKFKVSDFEPLFKTPGSWEAHVKQLRMGEIQVYSHNFHRGLGKEIPVEVYVSLRTIQGKEYVVAVSRNIADRIDTQKELEKHMGMLELLIHMANTYINAPIDQLDVLINQSLQELGGFVDADRAYVFDYNFEAGNCSNTFEWCAAGITPEIENLQEIPLDLIPYWVEKHQAGQVFFVEEVASLGEELLELKNILERQNIISLMTVPMRSPEGELLGFLGFDSVREKRIYSDRERQLLEVFSSMLVNIRQRALTQSKMKMAVAEAHAASKAKSEFLANMSHELRTPLNGVIGFVDLLRSTPLSPNQLEFVENTSISARALLDLINDVLDFSKIEAGKLEIEKTPCSLESLVEQSIDIVKYESARKQLELLLDFDLELPDRIITDALRLKQILVNLLSNAIKFTDVGEVRLRVVGKKVDDGYLIVFEVHDTGIGISAEQQKSLFKAFSQGDTSTSRRFGGSGLGLAISSFLVQKLGGQLQLHSELGQGSIFKFEIYTGVESVEIPEYKSRNFLLGKEVWMIENHFGAEQLLCNNLGYWQAEVTSFQTEKDTLAAITLKAPSLLIIDFHLGATDGRNLLRRIRTKGGANWAKVPVVMLQDATDDLSITSEDLELGVGFKLAKPIKMHELHDAITGLMQAQGKAKDGPKNTAEQPVRQILSSDSRPLIMLVDDVPLNLTLARWMLEKMTPGARLLEARSGEAALLIHAEVLKIDLIFMDVQMPDMDGLETTRLIREREARADRGEHIPIVALTAGALHEERNRCLAAGMDDFLTKPIHVEQLEMMLRKFLQKNNT